MTNLYMKKENKVKKKKKLKTIATTTCVVNEKTEKKQKNEMRKKLTNIVNKNKNLKKKYLQSAFHLKLLKTVRATDRQTKANENGNGKPGKAAGDNGRFAVRALPIDYFNKYSCQWANVEPLENGWQSNLSAEQREKSIKLLKENRGKTTTTSHVKGTPTSRGGSRQREHTDKVPRTHLSKSEERHLM